MSQKALSNWLKAIVLVAAACGAFAYLFVIPSYGKALALNNPEFAYCYTPWLLFIWGTALPCCAAAVYLWRIAVQIGLDNSFSASNAQSLKMIGVLAFADSAYFFLGNVALLLMGMSHPGIALIALFVSFFAAAVAAAALSLSHLVKKAELLQAQSDLTI